MIRQSRKLYVHIGCGFCAPKDWRNFDASLTLRFEKIPIIGRLYTKNYRRFPNNVEYGDVIKGLPGIKENSCEGIFFSHILEHLSFNDAKKALVNIYKILRPGGIFRIIVPDLEISVKKYLKEFEEGSHLASYIFHRDIGYGYTERVKGFTGFLKLVLSKSSHLWMWDKLSLKHELEQAGFKMIRECACGDSSDEMFNLVENLERFKESIAFECIK